jgi:hypothetical protein
MILRLNFKERRCSIKKIGYYSRYEVKELYEMLRGFQEDFPEGGIYRY